MLLKTLNEFDFHRAIWICWLGVVSCVRTQHGLKVKSGLYVYTGPGGAVVQGWHNHRLSLVNCLLILACDWLLLSYVETWHIPGTLYSILYMISGGCKPSANGTFVLRNEEEAGSYFLTHSLLHGLCNNLKQTRRVSDHLVPANSCDVGLVTPGQASVPVQPQWSAEYLCLHGTR